MRLLGYSPIRRLDSGVRWCPAATNCKAFAAHDPLRRQVELIDRTAVRASRLTQQLLAFSRKQVLQPTTVDVNSVVHDVSSMRQSLIGDDVVLDIATEAQRAAVKVDRHQLEQAIVNLVINARDAMPFGGRLAIATADGTLDAGRAGERDCPPRRLPYPLHRRYRARDAPGR
jgi:signal transduction histidine kinase